MNQVTFPALAGDSPLAILAAIGTLRLIHDFADDKARLRWDPAGHRPVLTSSLRTVDEVAGVLGGIVTAMPKGVSIPGGPIDFPPPGEAPDKLRVPQGCLPTLLAELTTGISEAETATLRSWLGSVITDLAVDSKKRGSVSQFIASSGKQSIATMLGKPLDLVRKEPDYLRQALVSWRRVPGVTGEYLDNRASWEATDDGRGQTGKMRGVPGATWLALMSYPLWTTTALRTRVRTSGWHSVSARRRYVQELRLPLWQEPLGPTAVKALIEHPVLDGDLGEPLNQRIRLLGIFHVCRARRHQPPGGKSAGILTPVPR